MKEKILAIDFLQHSTKFAVVKKDKENRFLIEIVCIENTSEEIIYLNDLFINSSSIQHINKFQCISSDNFYFNASIWENEKLVRYHLKVNFSGKIIKQTIDDLGIPCVSTIMMFAESLVDKKRYLGNHM